MWDLDPWPGTEPSSSALGAWRLSHWTPSVKGLVSHSCPTLCDPMDCSPPGSSVHGIFWARIREWLAIPFSRGSSRPRNQTWVPCTAGRLFTDWAPREALVFWPREFHGLYSPWGQRVRHDWATFSFTGSQGKSILDKEDHTTWSGQVSVTSFSFWSFSYV